LSAEMSKRQVKKAKAKNANYRTAARPVMSYV
jgi:hypothetical protein